MELPKLPSGYRWRSIETHKIVFEHTELGKSYGVRSFARDGAAVAGEIAYGIAKIERELERGREHLKNFQDFK